MKNDDKLLLSTRRALLGEVPQNLRAVAVEWSGEDVVVYFYNDGPMTDEEENDYLCIGTEIIASFSSGIIDERIIRLDYPSPIPEHRLLAYLKKEDLLLHPTVPYSYKVSNNPKEKVSRLLLSAQRALLGSAPSNLRAMAIEWSGEDVVVYFYNDGPMTGEEENDYLFIGRKIIANFGSSVIDERIIRLDYPNKIPSHNLWIFRRKEK